MKCERKSAEQRLAQEAVDCPDAPRLAPSNPVVGLLSVLPPGDPPPVSIGYLEPRVRRPERRTLRTSLFAQDEVESRASLAGRSGPLTDQVTHRGAQRRRCRNRRRSDLGGPEAHKLSRRSAHGHQQPWFPSDPTACRYPESATLRHSRRAAPALRDPAGPSPEWSRSRNPAARRRIARLRPESGRDLRESSVPSLRAASGLKLGLCEQRSTGSGLSLIPHLDVVVEDCTFSSSVRASTSTTT